MVMTRTELVAELQTLEEYVLNRIIRIMASNGLIPSASQATGASP